MIQLMGKKYFEEELIEFFNGADEILNGETITIILMNPNHHVPFLLNYTSQSWLTQYWTREDMPACFIIIQLTDFVEMKMWDKCLLGTYWRRWGCILFVPEIINMNSHHRLLIKLRLN